MEGILLGLCLFVGISFGMDMDDYLVTGSTTPRGKYTVPDYPKLP